MRTHGSSGNRLLEGWAKSPQLSTSEPNSYAACWMRPPKLGPTGNFS
jgi:hypothetical protein